MQRELDFSKLIEKQPLLEAFEIQRYAAPEVFALFVPHLVRSLVKNNNRKIQEMLNNYVTSAQRAEEILEAFLSIDKIELSSLEALLSFCLKIVMKKN